MGRIKLNLVSGASSDKPLINAFTENGNIYVVLDNEMNGSMGLPIILVSKYVDNKLTKITDQSEWQVVKEYLKNIIAGNKSEFIKLDNELSADDIYYTQLTLPVPSFDALKNAYPFKEEAEVVSNPVAEAISTPVEEPTINIAPVEAPAPTPEVAPVSVDTPASSEPMININPVATPVEPEVTSEPVINITPEVTPAPTEPQIAPVDINIPVAPEMAPEVAPMPEVSVAPNVSVASPAPEVAPTPEVNVAPAEETPAVNLDNPLLNNLNMPLSASAEEKEPEITPTPIIDANIPSTPVVEESIFKEQKEAFMQACENMFDALVQKFEKELENRK